MRIFIFLLLLPTLGFSQGIIALQSNGNTQIFTGTNAFAQAYSAAQNGDTLYLSGGYFFPVNINKRLVIFGAGHHPDSTAATSQTFLQGNLYLEENADSTYIEGLYINGDIRYVNSNQKLDNLTIRRNRFNILFFNGDRNNPSLQNLIEQNVIIGYIDVSNTNQLVFRNNICNERFNHGFGSIISNNIFLRSPHWNYVGGVPIYNTDNCFIYNNVFYNFSVYYENIVFLDCENSQIKNNLFITTPNYTNNTATGNYENYTQSNIFVNCTTETFNYSYDYHLQNPTVLTGTDGTQIGIYGGLFPWKEGSVPKNPHIIFKNIAPQTNNNGQLPIQIKVAAQNE